MLLLLLLMMMMSDPPLPTSRQTSEFELRMVSRYG